MADSRRRLAIAGKAHPFAMLIAPQAAAERTGERVVVLLLAGAVHRRLHRAGRQAGEARLAAPRRAL